MSKLKNYWYSIALQRVKRYPKIKDDDSQQAKTYTKAIEDVLDRTEAYDYGDLRIKAINMLYFNHTHTIDGVALELNVSRRTVQRWTNQFISEVGKEAGE